MVILLVTLEVSHYMNTIFVVVHKNNNGISLLQLRFYLGLDTFKISNLYFKKLFNQIYESMFKE